MKRKITKRVIAGALAVLVGCSSFLQGMAGVSVYASGTAMEPDGLQAETAAVRTEKQLPMLEEVIGQLGADEIVTAEDYALTVGEAFDAACNYTGLSFDDTKVKVTYKGAKSTDGRQYDRNTTGTYQAVYYVEPVSGNPSYQITRNIIVGVKEPETQPDGSQGGTEDESSPEDGDADAEPEPEIKEQLLNEPEMPKNAEGTVNVNDEDNGIFLSVVSASATLSRAAATLVKGEIIAYPTSLGNYSTHYFTVNGKVAYCLESSKAAPPSSSYVASEYESNLKLQKILYYGYGGPGDITDSYMPGFSWQTKYVFTHVAASYSYVGTAGFYGCTMESVQACGLWDYIQYIYSLDAPPTAEISLSPTGAEAYESGDLQRTERFKLTGDSSNYITVSLPDNVTYHSGDTTKSSGSVKIYGGTSFYFSAPKTVTGTWSSGTLNGQMATQWKTMVLSTSGDVQDVGYGAFFDEPHSSVSFKVKWMDLAKVKVIKQDAESSVKLSGAVFGIYSDKACTNLITKMPATDSSGAAEVEIPKTQDTVYLKEISAPIGYKIDTSAYNVNLVAGKSTTVTVGNHEQKGRITVRKQGEELVKIQGDKVNQEFIYENTAYAEAKYKVYAAETIYSQDQKTKIHESGDLVAELTTGADGSATTGDLYLGKYRVVEEKAPANLVIGKSEADRTHYVTLSYAGQTVEIAKGETTYHNERPSVEVKAVKKSVNDGVTLEGAVFGLFAGSDIKKADGTVLVSKGTQISQAISGADGIASFVTDMPIGYTYYIKELTAPEFYYMSNEIFTFRYTYANDTTYTYAFEGAFQNEEVRGEVHINKIDIDAQDFISQGDASLSGAKYGLYAAEDIQYPNQKSGLVHKKDELVAQGVISKEGTLDFTDLYLGNYYVKEIEAGAGYLVDETSYPVKVNYEGQEVKIVHRYVTVKETVKKQAFQLIKISEDGEQTETDLVEGAGFKIYLISSLSGIQDGTHKPADGKAFTAADFIGYDYSREETAWYYENGKKINVPELLTDAKGYLRSPELPYGTYVIFESTTPDNLQTVNPFIVTISNDSREPQAWRVFDDRPFQFYFKIIKKDAQTQQAVLNNSASYKVFDVEADAYVEMIVRYPKYEKISVFETNEEGYLITPEQLKAGTYRIEEVRAPVFYVQPGYEMALELDDVEIPLNQTVTGGEYHDAAKAGIVVTVDSNTAHQVEEETGKTIILVEQYNDEAVGSLKLMKRGEKLAAVQAQEEKLTAKLKNVFAGIVNQISHFLFDKDAVSAVTGYTFDYEIGGMEGAGFNVYAKETIYTPDGQTDEAGNRIVRFEKDQLVEILVTDENGEASLNNLPIGSYYLEETKAGANCVLDTEIKEFEITYHGQETAVDYITMDLTNERQKIEIKILKSDAETKKAIEGVQFALFNEEEITGARGEVLLAEDTLIEFAVTDKDGKLIFKSDLPHGKYYAVEVKQKAGYLPYEETIRFDAAYRDSSETVIRLRSEVENQPTVTEFTKVDITDEAEIEGATLQVIKDGKIIEEWVSGKKPHIIYALDPGDYILHEELASEGYLVASDVSFTVEETGKVRQVMMKDERAAGRLVILKTDADTKDSLEGVEFTLTKKESGEEVGKLITDKDGRAESGLLPIGTFENGTFKEKTVYVLTETKGLEGYDKNEETYEIIFEYQDGNTPVIEVVKEITNQKTKSNEAKSNAPKTGDTTDILYAVAALVVAGGTSVYVGLRMVRRRKKKSL